MCKKCPWGRRIHTPSICSENIVQLMKEQDITPKQLASRMFVSAEVVYKWRRGDRTPSLEQAAKLAQIFGITVDELIRSDRK